MLKSCITVLGLVAALLALGLFDVRGSELLDNGGFEDGTIGWAWDDPDHGQLAVVDSPVHGGARAALLTETSLYQELRSLRYQPVPVQPGQSYEFSGWVLLNDPDIQHVFLRITLSDAGDAPLHMDESPWLEGNLPAYRYLSTGPQTAPGTAAAARVSVVVWSSGAFVIYLDDFSLQGPAVPTPTPAPVPSPTAAATATPSPTASATPGPTPTPQATPTSTPSTPAPATTSPAPSRTSPPAPSTTPTHTPFVTPTATSTPSPAPPRPPSEPTVFARLVNGGFEQLRSDGSPYGWRKIGGTLSTVSGPVAEGSSAIALASGTSATKWVYQTVSVQGGSWYEASARAWKSDANAAAVFLRLSWYDTADGSGESIGYADSTDILTADAPAFRLLATGSVQAPADARTAKLRLMLRPASAAKAIAYFDDAQLAESESAPTAAPGPSATPSASVAATATPPAATPAPTATATPGPEPAWEPDVFPQLTNSSFEDAREDGTPYGWRKAGGQATVSNCETPDGLCLQLQSSTASTKWAYQTVSVQPGGYYEAGVMAQDDDPGVAAVFLRVSWYAAGGGGQAIGAADSNAVLDVPAPQFRPLTTGPIQAPAGAGTAKVRLMLRPASAGPASVLFDDATFLAVAGPDPAAADAGATGVDTPQQALAPGQAVRATAAGARTLPAAATALAAVSPTIAAPAKLANVRPAPPAAASAPSSDAGRGAGWLLVLGIGGPLAAILAAGVAFGLVRGRSRSPREPG